MKDAIRELVNHCAERTMIVEMEKFVKDLSALLDVAQILVVLIINPVLVNSVRILVMHQQHVDRMPYVQCTTIKLYVNVLHL